MCKNYAKRLVGTLPLLSIKLNFQALSFSIGAQDLALALKDIGDAVEMLKSVLNSFFGFGFHLELDDWRQQQLSWCFNNFHKPGTPNQASAWLLKI